MKKLVLFIALASLSACSVKEDRAFCPAWCVVYSDGYVAEGCSGNVTCNVATPWEDIYEYDHSEFSRFYTKGDLVLEVPRNEKLYLDVFCGVDEMDLNGSVLTIPMGFCCDCIYSGHGSIIIRGEEGAAGLPLNKDFALLEMKVAGEIPDEPLFDFRILGNVDGYSLPGGAPHRGEFDYSPREESGHCYRARLPRQADDTLLLDIMDKADGFLVARLPLGEIIRNLGYDWSVADLKDISIVIYLSAANFEIEVTAWDNSEIINVIL